MPCRRHRVYLRIAWGLQFGSAVKLAPSDKGLQTTASSSDLPDIFTKRHPDRMGDEAYVERIWSCTAVYPKGREIKTYQTPLQAIEAFYDVLGGLRDLYQRCKILHRDVSIYNILLTNPSVQANQDNPPKGFLIDFEGALDLKNPPKRNQIVGTTVFMAIGLLQGKLPYTYRYDLESFFYSLIWFCVQPRTTKIRPPNGSRLWRWCDADDDQLAENKLQDMTPDHFQMILDEFQPDFHQFRGLADSIRKLLFPVQADGSLNIKTDQSEDGSNALYDGIRQKFEAFIEQGER